MKISTNPVGNYHPVVTPKVSVVQPKQEVKAQEVKAQDVNVTGEERSFFIRMYPEKTNDIVDYHFYQPNGRMSGVATGTVFDRRG